MNYIGDEEFRSTIQAVKNKSEVLIALRCCMVLKKLLQKIIEMNNEK